MRHRLAPLVLAFGLATPAAAQTTTAQGVYTAGQASRGAVLYDTQCATCHRDGGAAPVLTGERFTRLFADATLLTLFTSIKTTMPRNAPASLSDAEYTDIVARLLQLNGQTEGPTELQTAWLDRIRIPGQGGTLDFALVQVVGCLAQAGRTWTLSSATEPVRTREPEPATDEEAAALDPQPLGTRTFRLQQVYGGPSGWAGEKVAAKGFLTRSGSEERLSVTSLRPLISPCRN